jgi:hypothetical protein
MIGLLTTRARLPHLLFLSMLLLTLGAASLLS